MFFVSEKKLKKCVDEYFEKYMCVSFDKFLENWEETSQENKRLDKENKRLDKDLNKSAAKINSLIDEKKILENKINELFAKCKTLKGEKKTISSSKGGHISKYNRLEKENQKLVQSKEKYKKQVEILEKQSLTKDETIRSLTEENTKAHRELHEANINIEKFKNFIAKKLGRPLTTAEDVIKYDRKRPSRRK